MDCFDALCDKLNKVGTLQPNNQLEIDADGSVHIVKEGGVRYWNRKLVNITKQSRKTTVARLEELITLANELSSGMMRLPMIRTDTFTVGETDEVNSQYVEEAIASTAAAAEKTLEVLNESDKEKLQILASALLQTCAAMNRLMNSTYAADTDTSAELMCLINYAQLIVKRLSF